jgi:hypothetical protein
MAAPGMTEIPNEEHDELVSDQLLLQALIACGVDNWDSYSDAQELAEDMAS